MFKKYLKLSILPIIFSLSVFSFVFGNIGYAQDENTPITEALSDECKENGDCEVEQIVILMVGIANFILGIVGSVALMFFIYGGFMFILSSGNNEKVTQAKNIIIGATFGIVIVFTSYMIVRAVLTALDIEGVGSGLRIKLTDP